MPERAKPTIKGPIGRLQEFFGEREGIRVWVENDWVRLRLLLDDHEAQAERIKELEAQPHTEHRCAYPGERLMSCGLEIAHLQRLLENRDAKIGRLRATIRELKAAGRAFTRAFADDAGTELDYRETPTTETAHSPPAGTIEGTGEVELTPDMIADAEACREFREYQRTLSQKERTEDDGR